MATSRVRGLFVALAALAICLCGFTLASADIPQPKSSDGSTRRLARKHGENTLRLEIESYDGDEPQIWLPPELRTCQVQQYRNERLAANTDDRNRCRDVAVDCVRWHLARAYAFEVGRACDRGRREHLRGPRRDGDRRSRQRGAAAQLRARRSWESRKRGAAGGHEARWRIAVLLRLRRRRRAHRPAGAEVKTPGERLRLERPITSSLDLRSGGSGVRRVRRDGRAARGLVSDLVLHRDGLSLRGAPQLDRSTLLPCKAPRSLGPFAPVLRTRDRGRLLARSRIRARTRARERTRVWGRGLGRRGCRLELRRRPLGARRYVECIRGRRLAIGVGHFLSVSR